MGMRVAARINGVVGRCLWFGVRLKPRGKGDCWRQRLPCASWRELGRVARVGQEACCLHGPCSGGHPRWAPRPAARRVPGEVAAQDTPPWGTARRWKGGSGGSTRSLLGSVFARTARGSCTCTVPSRRLCDAVDTEPLRKAARNVQEFSERPRRERPRAAIRRVRGGVGSVELVVSAGAVLSRNGQAEPRGSAELAERVGLSGPLLCVLVRG